MPTKSSSSDPLNILRLFEEALRTGILIHPDAMCSVAANLDRIDDRALDPEAVTWTCCSSTATPNALRRMNEPRAGRLHPRISRRSWAMMQFNVYHHYTVDEHLIQCVAALASIERGVMKTRIRLSSPGSMKDKINPPRHLSGALLHDIGKGRSRGSLDPGARLARHLHALACPVDEIETIEWLIRNHLLMSDVAQKRDIADPRVLVRLPRR